MCQKTLQHFIQWQQIYILTILASRRVENKNGHLSLANQNLPSNAVGTVKAAVSQTTSVSCQNERQCPSDHWEISGSHWVESDVPVRLVQSRRVSAGRPVDDRVGRSDIAADNAASSPGCRCAASPTCTVLLVFYRSTPRRLTHRPARHQPPVTVHNYYTSPVNYNTSPVTPNTETIIDSRLSPSDTNTRL